EKRLYRRYFELLATATTGFRGERATLTGLARYSDDADRALRRAACEAGWSIFDAHAQELDELFDALVRCRAAIAQTCGFRSFAEVAVRRQGRTSYGAAEVARFRDAIRTSIVPFVLRCERERAAALGVDELMPWDESAYDLGPAIVPPLGEAALLGALREALGATHPAIGTFVQTSIDCGSIDVAARPGKAGGAFCVFLPRARTPFVVTNAAGVAQDVASLVHEFGHAFAHDRCREAILLEHALPANDVAEIHSMALEFLAEPQYECFFGASAQRYRQRQLASRVRSFPYIAAIDHFQELVYAHPSATAQERHEMWREMEARYLPWRRSGGIAFIERGGAWQRQRHVYAFPFYYVDYGLALYAALTLRREALEDRGAALERYLALCSLGGRRSFLETLAAAGIGSPFHEGALEELVC
ncbi:MAG TPA: M3 family metallopeptidase, partial [Verrucomicrobiae bacterium]|nr:M3 family metallopeptidase [Verrucomicrobiae bacterium]